MNSSNFALQCHPCYPSHFACSTDYQLGCGTLGHLSNNSSSFSSNSSISYSLCSKNPFGYSSFTSLLLSRDCHLSFNDNNLHDFQSDKNFQRPYVKAQLQLKQQLAEDLKPNLDPNPLGLASNNYFCIGDFSFQLGLKRLRSETGGISFKIFIHQFQANDNIFSLSKLFSHEGQLPLELHNLYAQLLSVHLRLLLSRLKRSDDPLGKLELHRLHPHALGDGNNVIGTLKGKG